MMSFVELIILSVGLAADAFSVSLCKGLSMKRINYTVVIITALFFGTFQAIMPIIGYLIGNKFEKCIISCSPWVTLLILGLIGLKMLFDSFGSDKACEIEKEISFNIVELIILSFATSIDAFTIGIVLAAEQVNIIVSAVVIGIITFLLSLTGICVGKRFGNKYEQKAEAAGGIILIVIGVKIFLEGISHI